MKKLTCTLGNSMVDVALRIWGTDLAFRQYPYGPPSRGIVYGTAWQLYHLGCMIEKLSADTPVQNPS